MLQSSQKNGHQGVHDILHCHILPPLPPPHSITTTHQAHVHPHLPSPISPLSSVPRRLRLPHLCIERRCQSPDSHSHGPLPPCQPLPPPFRPRGVAKGPCPSRSFRLRSSCFLTIWQRSDHPEAEFGHL